MKSKDAPWSHAEDLSLLKARQQDLLSWRAIGHMLGRSHDSCRSHYRFVISLNGDQDVESTVIDDVVTNKNRHITTAGTRISTLEELIKECKIDTTIWECTKFRVRTSEAYRKDKKGDWHTGPDGVRGDVHDTGKILVVPLHHTSAEFIKKIDVARSKEAIEDTIQNMLSFSPTYPKIEYPSHDGVEYLYELGLPDLHFGRLSWNAETGIDYDIQIARKMIMSVVNQLLSYATLFPIKKVLLPLGSDFFNVDNKDDTTTKGTPQQEDTRWQKTFSRGRDLAVEMIDACSLIAPVDVVVFPGNHDEQRSFYLGEALVGWYRNHESVSIDNSPSPRKYYSYGKDLIGLTHGAEEKLDGLPLLMAIEAPQQWAASTYREIHTGDKHHKKDINVFADEKTGIVVRILRSLTPPDSWTNKKGFKSMRAGEAFLWHPTKGVQAQFTATS